LRQWYIIYHIVDAWSYTIYHILGHIPSTIFPTTIYIPTYGTMSSSGEEESDEEQVVRYAFEGDSSVLSKEAHRNARMLEAVMEGREDAEDADEGGRRRMPATKLEMLVMVVNALSESRKPRVS
jgi:hypothetical protein